MRTPEVSVFPPCERVTAMLCVENSEREREREKRDRRALRFMALLEQVAPSSLYVYAKYNRAGPKRQTLPRNLSKRRPKTTSYLPAAVNSQATRFARVVARRRGLHVTRNSLSLSLSLSLSDWEITADPYLATSLRAAKSRQPPSPCSSPSARTTRTTTAADYQKCEFELSHRAYFRYDERYRESRV